MSYLKLTHLSTLVFCAFTLTACVLLEPYEADKKQGNSIRAEQIDQLAIGQSAAQVMAILGTPMLTGQKPGERWIYPIKQNDDSYQHVVVSFDTHGFVSAINTLAP